MTFTRPVTGWLYSVATSMVTSRPRAITVLWHERIVSLILAAVSIALICCPLKMVFATPILL